MFFNSSCISLRILRSSAPSGSSKSRISGSFTSARAIAILCCCPPESVDTLRRSKPSKSTISNTRLTLRRISSCGSFFSLSPNAILSKMFMCGKSAYLWNTVLIGRLFAGIFVISSPFNRISPLVGISKPAIMRSVVVFPQPDGPKKVTNSPLPTSRLKSSTAAKPSSYRFPKCLSSIIFFDFSCIFCPFPSIASDSHIHIFVWCG